MFLQNSKAVLFLLLAIISNYLLTSAELTSAGSLSRIRYSENISKIIHLSTDETVKIDGVIYKVPAPWKGKKLPATALTFDDFGAIPKDATWQGSNLYVLKDTAIALSLMIEKAKEDGILLVAHSAYRSRGYQRRIFIKLMSEGRSFNDVIRYVAPPGYSEHMLGTVVDFYPSNWEFASIDGYKWLKENASHFGFFESYPETGTEAPWEPWHWKHIPETIEQAETNEKQ